MAGQGRDDQRSTSVSQDQASPVEPARRAFRSRFKIHQVYYLLAAFDVVTISLSLILIAGIVGSYQRSAEENQRWAGRMVRCWRLTRMAGEVNAPGNDVFQRLEGGSVPAADVDHFARELADLDLAFREELDRLDRDLNAAPPRDAGPDWTAILDGIRSTAASMVTRAERIFVELRQDRVTEATNRMAAMDQSHAALLHELETLGSAVSAIQDANVQGQVALASRARRWEIGIALLILVMVCAVTVYGRSLARRHRDFQTELARYRDHLEGLVEERTRELASSLEKLRLSDRLASIGTLAAGLGHDMNNVLFPVRCRLDVVSAANLESGLREEIDSVRQSIDYLQQLSDGLRLLGLDPDDPGASPSLTEPGPWWDEVRPLFLTALPSNATLEGDVAPGLPPLAVAPHRLTQAMFNLVVNAGEVLGEGGTVRVWARPGPAAGEIQVGVTDDGSGMSDEVRRQALDPFFTTKKRGFSTGLGLAVVHGVASGAGGRVDIDSDPGRGTTVTLTLPAAGAGSRTSAEAGSDGRTALVSVAKRRIATLVASLLRSAGIEARVAPGASPEDETVWVAEAATTSTTQVRRFLDEGAGRRVLAIGTTPDEWRALGATSIDMTAGLPALRGAIRSVVGDGVPA